MSGENHYSTSSRKKILEILKKSKDKTITASQIGDQLKAMESEVNITTVYRYLDRRKRWNCDPLCFRPGYTGFLSICRTGSGMRRSSAPEMCKMWKNSSPGLRIHERNLRTHPKGSRIFPAMQKFYFIRYLQRMSGKKRIRDKRSTIMDIYLIRHGETDWNRMKKLQGNYRYSPECYGIELARKLLKG